MENDNFKEMLLQYGHEEVFGFINSLARYGIKNLSNDKTLDTILEGLNKHFKNINNNMAYIYEVITNNYGANELLKDTITINLLREEFINDRINLDMINEYNRLYDQISEYKQILIDYENIILNKKTR